MSFINQVLVATYHVEECFIIPKNIDMEDRTQVAEHWVKRGTLHIKLTNGKVITIQSQGMSDDLKYPESTRIEDAEDMGYAPEDYEDEFADIDLGIFETHETKVYTDLMAQFTGEDEIEPHETQQIEEIIDSDNDLYV